MSPETCRVTIPSIELSIDFCLSDLVYPEIMARARVSAPVAEYFSIRALAVSSKYGRTELFRLSKLVIESLADALMISAG